jgi:hypothetical protein
MTTIFYKSYAEAHNHLGISGDPDKMIISGPNGVECVKITDHYESYHWISSNKAIIRYVGIGPLKSPGHPSSNQQYDRQQPFLDSWGKRTPICVLLKDYDGNVMCMGMYNVRNMRKCMGNEGLTYFTFELIRTVIR